MAENKIVYADEMAAEARATGMNYNEVRAKLQADAIAEHPIYLGIVDAVNYIDKSDRYVAKFDKSSARLSTSAAEFLLQHALGSSRTTMRPTVNAHSENGIIDAVLLTFLSREQ